METLGIKTTQEELKLMVSEIDQNGNGEVDFDEFVHVMSPSVLAQGRKVDVSSSGCFEDTYGRSGQDFRHVF